MHKMCENHWWILRVGNPFFESQRHKIPCLIGLQGSIRLGLDGPTTGSAMWVYGCLLGWLSCWFEHVRAIEPLETFQCPKIVVLVIGLAATSASGFCGGDGFAAPGDFSFRNPAAKATCLQSQGGKPRSKCCRRFSGKTKQKGNRW